VVHLGGEAVRDVDEGVGLHPGVAPVANRLELGRRGQVPPDDVRVRVEVRLKVLLLLLEALPIAQQHLQARVRGAEVARDADLVADLGPRAVHHLSSAAAPTTEIESERPWDAFVSPPTMCMS